MYLESMVVAEQKHNTPAPASNAHLLQRRGRSPDHHRWRIVESRAGAVKETELKSLAAAGQQERNWRG